MPFDGEYHEPFEPPENVPGAALILSLLAGIVALVVGLAVLGAWLVVLGLAR